MKITKKELISEPGNQINEDIATITTNAAWVIDGATGVGTNLISKSDSDAQWFVNQWDKFLKKEITNFDLDLKTILKKGIQEIHQKYLKESKSPPTELDHPSASIAIIRWQEEIFEAFVLGDCSIIINNKEISDIRVMIQDRFVIKEIVTLQKDPKITHQEVQEKIKPLLQKNRLTKNTQKGYWILEFNKEAIEKGIYKKDLLPPQAKVLLTSDGFSRLSDYLHFYRSGNELLESVTQNGLKPEYEKLRKTESSDPECRRYPRVKKHDDASAIYIELNR